MALLTKDAEKRVIALLISEGLADANLTRTLEQEAEAKDELSR